MFLGNTDPVFPALLKNEAGLILAEGRASASRMDRMVSFTSDFVPLYPRGTPMEVVRIQNGTEVHRFTGTVYLSDKVLMRLVSVDDELLPGSEEVYCAQMSFPAQLTARPDPKSVGLLKRLFMPSAEPFPITISALTYRQFVFQQTMRAPLEEGQLFQFTAEDPLPIEASVVLTKAMLFGQNAAYLCDFVDLDSTEEQRLQAYLVIFNLTRNKLF